MSQENNNITNEQSQDANKYRARTIRDIRERPIPPPTPILSDGILTFESQACIVARPKVGKSTFAIHMGLKLGQGSSFLGLEVLRPCKVLYLNFEIHEALMDERVEQMRGRIAVWEKNNFQYLTLLGRDIPQVNTERGKEQLVQIIQVNADEGFKPDVLILDDRWKMTVGDPNQEANIKPLVTNLEDIRKMFSPMAIVVIHHHGKNTTGVGAGSSAWDRWVNTAFDMRPHHWEGTEGGLRPSKEVKVEIGGNYTPGSTMYVVRDKWNFWVGGREVWQKPIQKWQEAQRFIIEELQDGAESEAENKSKALASGIKESTYETALKRLKETGVVTAKQDPTKQGRYNILELTPDR